MGRAILDSVFTSDLSWHWVATASAPDPDVEAWIPAAPAEAQFGRSHEPYPNCDNLLTNARSRRWVKLAPVPVIAHEREFSGQGDRDQVRELWSSRFSRSVFTFGSWQSRARSTGRGAGSTIGRDLSVLPNFTDGLRWLIRAWRGLGLWGPSHPHTVPAVGALRGQDGGHPVRHPYLLARELRILAADRAFKPAGRRAAPAGPAQRARTRPRLPPPPHPPPGGPAASAWL
jgi:hypothetical protein